MFTWSNVLSSRFYGFGNRDGFFKIVKMTGYPYFMWNDRIYEVQGDSYSDTGHTIHDMEQGA